MKNSLLIIITCLFVSGQPHEIHAATDTLPGIVLHVAEGHENNTSTKIPHTRLPEKWNGVLYFVIFLLDISTYV